VIDRGALTVQTQRTASSPDPASPQAVALLSRRSCLLQLTGLAAGSTLAALLPAPSIAWSLLPGTESVSETDRERMARIGQQFMDRFQAPGLSFAIARHGQLVFQQALGMADPNTREKMDTTHRFRIASVTKPLTSTAVFSLIEQKKFGLEDPVFGTYGVLGNDYGKDLPSPVRDITIHHLLTHTGGGWDNGPGDPMFQSPALSQRELIEHTLRQVPLDHAPGTHYAYSNFGYCLLGRVIEKVTGKPYAAFMQQQILDRCGINDMAIAGNGLTGRANHEVTYYGQNGEDPYAINVTRMDSHGGWLATPTDLVNFALRVDGFDNPPDILSQAVSGR
jgi:CubicO group peptidase (beta-lactamase class C family)